MRANVAATTFCITFSRQCYTHLGKVLLSACMGHIHTILYSSSTLTPSEKARIHLHFRARHRSKRKNNDVDTFFAIFFQLYYLDWRAKSHTSYRVSVNYRKTKKERTILWRCIFPAAVLTVQHIYLTYCSVGYALRAPQSGRCVIALYIRVLFICVFVCVRPPVCVCVCFLKVTVDIRQTRFSARTLNHLIRRVGTKQKRQKEKHRHKLQ